MDASAWKKKMNDDVIGVFYWDDDFGRHYRCRGIGEKYVNFYKWLESTSYRSTSTDWPWDFFVFDNPEDDKKILEKWSDVVIEDRI